MTAKNPDQLLIPGGIGISRRVFIAMAVVLSLIVILFLFFINHYSPHKRPVSAVQKTASVAAETDVSNMIDKIEQHKYQGGSGSVSKTASVKGAQDTTKQVMADDSFKTAGESQLSVYNSPNSVSSNAENIDNSGGSLPTNESEAAQAQPDQYAAQNGQNQKIAFLKSGNNNHDIIYSQLKVPLSKYEITAGTIIPATLVTGIDSDLPGTITAKVSRDIFDTATGNYLLIPQGTTVIGAYDSQVSYGQSRILIAWQRLIFPDGNSFDLNGMPGADLAGMAGLSDVVDHHYARIFGSALLMSVFGAGGQLSQAQNNNHMDTEQIIYGAVGQEMSQTSARMIAKNMDIQPTIQIRPGSNFNVLLTRDMVLPTFYHFS